jgi:hypothetical protein
LILSSDPFSFVSVDTNSAPRPAKLEQIDPKIAPALQHQAEELKRAQLETALAHKIEKRPPVSELIDHNILRGEFVIQFLAHSSLERVVLLLQLYVLNILFLRYHVLDSHVAPALQRQEAELKRSQLEDMLNTKIHDRPKPDELIQKHILGNVTKTKTKGNVYHIERASSSLSSFVFFFSSTIEGQVV